MTVDYPDGNYYPPPSPYYYNNGGPGYYRPMMPRGYPMQMPIPPGQVPYGPGGYPPPMYPMPPDMRPPFQGGGNIILNVGGPIMPYVMVQGANGQWYPSNPGGPIPSPDHNPENPNPGRIENPEAEKEDDVQLEAEPEEEAN